MTQNKGVGTAGATGTLAPAMLKPRGRKYLFALAITYQVYQLVDSQTSISLSSWLPGRRSEGLQESSPEELKMHQNSWRSGLRLGHHWELTALPSPPSKNPNPGSTLRTSSFGPSGLALPPQCWFRSNATDLKSLFGIERAPSRIHTRCRGVSVYAWRRQHCVCLNMGENTERSIIGAWDARPLVVQSIHAAVPACRRYLWHLQKCPVPPQRPTSCVSTLRRQLAVRQTVTACWYLHLIPELGRLGTWPEMRDAVTMVR